ncbi:MAG: hypothetical protein WBM32_00050 [Crocosphaera sp.]|jgi:hypothetical protein
MFTTDDKIDKLYHNIVNKLSPNEKLLLASLILNDLAQTNAMTIDYSDTWTEEDQNDVTTFTLNYSDEIFKENEEII